MEGFLVASTGENPLECVTDGCYLYLSLFFFSCYPFIDLARVNEIELTTGGSGLIRLAKIPHDEQGSILLAGDGSSSMRVLMSSRRTVKCHLYWGSIPSMCAML